jgi:hypothetical protein
LLVVLKGLVPKSASLVEVELKQRERESNQKNNKKSSEWGESLKHTLQYTYMYIIYI